MGLLGISRHIHLRGWSGRNGRPTGVGLGLTNGELIDGHAQTRLQRLTGRLLEPLPMVLGAFHDDIDLVRRMPCAAELSIPEAVDPPCGWG